MRAERNLIKTLTRYIIVPMVSGQKLKIIILTLAKQHIIRKGTPQGAE